MCNVVVLQLYFIVKFFPNMYSLRDYESIVRNTMTANKISNRSIDRYEYTARRINVSNVHKINSSVLDL